MKFGIVKLPKTFCKNTEKKYKRKKSNNKELSSFEDRNVNTNFCYCGRKSFVTLQAQCHCCGEPERPYHLCWFTKIRFFGTSCKVKKTDSDAKSNNNVQYYLYLIKVTYISSKLKFLNPERVVVQVSNTKLNIQSLHL